MQRDVDGSDALGRVHLQDIRAFCAVAGASSITVAAAALAEDKGAVSRRLKRLEAALGQRLLRRGARSVALTEDGAVYYEIARRAITLLDDGRDALRERHGGVEGNIRVTAPPDLAATILAPLLESFLSRHPKVSLDVIVSDRLLDFESEDIDVALRAVGTLPDTDLVAHRLVDVEGGLFATPTHLRAHGEPRTPKDLTRHAVVLRRPSSRRSVSLSLRRGDKTHRVMLTPRLCSMDFLFLRAAALAGIGITELPSLAATDHVRDGALVRVLPDHAPFTASLHLLSRKTSVLPRRVRSFRDFMVSQLGA